MSLSESEVRHVATLARLALSTEQVDTLRGELNSILGHIDAIQRLDLTDVAPMTHAVPLVNETREDVVIRGLARDDALLNAPDAQDGAFRIPRIVGVGEEG